MKPRTYTRSGKDRRQEHLGPPEDGERRLTLADRRAENNIGVLTARVADLEIGFPVGSIQEIVPRGKVTRVPLAPPELAGLMNLRGRIASVLNVRVVLGLGPGVQEGGMWIVHEDSEELFCFEVDSVGDVVQIGKFAFQPAPVTLREPVRTHCVSVVQMEKGLLLNVEPRSLIGGRKIKEEEQNG